MQRAIESDKQTVKELEEMVFCIDNGVEKEVRSPKTMNLYPV